MDTTKSSAKVDECIAETAMEVTQTKAQAVKQEEEINQKFLQIEDSTLDHLPKHVEQLLNDFPSKTQIDLLIGLIYCVAVETGFADIDTLLNETQSLTTIEQPITILTTNEPEISSTSNIINIEENLNNTTKSTEEPTSSTSKKFELTDDTFSIITNNFSYFWGFSFNLKFVTSILKMIPKNYQDLSKTNHNIYKLNLNLIKFTNTITKLIGIQTGEFLLLTLTIEGSTGKSVCLSIPRYIIQKSIKLIKPNIFRNLKELSYILKEKLFIPIRNRLMEESNILYPGLNGIPIELLNEILKYIKIENIHNLSKTCWKMRCCCIDYYELKYNLKKDTLGSKLDRNDVSSFAQRRGRLGNVFQRHENPRFFNSHYIN